MHIPISIASAESLTATNLVITGFLFVVIVLTMLAAMTWLGGRYFAARDAANATPPKKTLKAPKPAPAPAAASAASDEGDQLAAVITAAIHVALQDQPFRVRSIRRMAPGWAQEGRRQIFSSHRVR